MSKNWEKHNEERHSLGKKKQGKKLCRLRCSKSITKYMTCGNRNLKLGVHVCKTKPKKAIMPVQMRKKKLVITGFCRSTT